MTDSTAQTEDLREVMSTCLDLENPRSFFLFAGAGSGKTWALVEAMEIFRRRYGQKFRLTARKVAVITYTNAARDEIKHRINYDPIFVVSTIHSFAWELIKSFSPDIREWLKSNLKAEINELEEKQQKGRAGTKAAIDRVVQIESKQRRMERVETIKNFTYNPNGENIGKNSLNHAEVINIAAEFLYSKPLMQSILVRKYPVLLIDESQDTQKALIDAFFEVQKIHSGKFSLALFGDTMQRIYSDGKIGLERIIPEGWAVPAITINHRCPRRIVKLINTIRAEADGQKQEPREDASEGIVRLFLVLDNEGISKTAVEEEIAKMMAELTSDLKWAGDNRDIKILTLEHHMAARRSGFSGFFEPLYQIPKLKTGLLDGTLSGISFFSLQVLPLIKALQANNKIAVAQIVKKYTPLVSADNLKTSDSSLAEIRKADDAVKALFSLWDNGTDPLLIDILKTIANNGLFAIPDVIKPIVSRDDSLESNDEHNNSTGISDDNDPIIDAWDEALSVSFSQLESYVEYISDKSSFGTHQGIKGLQFSRVMVVLDDNEARGFMFSYDKLFGAKSPSSTDIRNAKNGNETSIDRTRRLFYVICSRAKSSLAIVVYTKEIEKVIGHLKNLKWFDDNEIIVMNDSTAKQSNEES